MLPTTRAKTLKSAQSQSRQEWTEHVQTQKEQMLKAVNDAVLQYSASTGKKEETAWQELFTMEHLTQQKRTLCARDIFLRDKMQEINKGTCSKSIRMMLGIFP